MLIEITKDEKNNPDSNLIRGTIATVNDDGLYMFDGYQWIKIEQIDTNFLKQEKRKMKFDRLLKKNIEK